MVHHQQEGLESYEMGEGPESCKMREGPESYEMREGPESCKMREGPEGYEMCLYHELDCWVDCRSEMVGFQDHWAACRTEMVRFHHARMAW